MTSALVFFSFFASTVMLSKAAILNVAKEPLPENNDIRNADDALQKAYAQRYRLLLENLPVEAALENGLSAEDIHVASRPLDKRAQTFVRFGKRAQTFVRFGRDACQLRSSCSIHILHYLPTLDRNLKHILTSRLQHNLPVIIGYLNL
ncbi:hypothetical protein Tcan_12963 [Toxocara canis]|uniref:Uncharacterized protein n=1 Tax=Toxocara canis TaxID=6265 RepID=A0A0B2UMX2_TOXCA|nr:hypothetical protein Tcan_12963 [Toxocara canis]